MYKNPAEDPKVSAAELAYINQGPPSANSKIAWSKLIPHRQTWAFVAGKVITDPIWWFYLYWLPGFLNARFGLTVAGMGLPLLVIYNVCTFGSIFGGWLPARFIAMGWSVNRARKTAMFLYALAVTPIMFVGRTHTLWQAIALISLATAAHQAWSANLFTIASDMFPRRAVASVVGSALWRLSRYDVLRPSDRLCSPTHPRQLCSSISSCRICLYRRNRRHPAARTKT